MEEAHQVDDETVGNMWRPRDSAFCFLLILNFVFLILRTIRIDIRMCSFIQLHSFRFCFAAANDKYSLVSSMHKRKEMKRNVQLNVSARKRKWKRFLSQMRIWWDFLIQCSLAVNVAVSYAVRKKTANWTLLMKWRQY